MTVLAITDIPRMTDLFERLSRDREGLVVVSEIHRGIEELDRIKPAVIIIQNHLSGLSADILLKHLKSRLGRRRCRFGLISPSETMDVETSARFEGIMDPSQSDAELEAVLDALVTPPERRAAAPATGTAQQPEKTPDEHVQDLSRQTTGAPEDDQQLPEPITYEMPRRPNMSIVSAFSQQLDGHADEKPEEKPAPALTQVEYLHEGLHHHRDDLLITDIEEPPPPLYRRTWVQVLAVTLLISVAVTAYQQRSRSGKSAVKPESQKAAATQPDKAHKPHSSTTGAAAGMAKPFATHGSGRPKALPSFVPRTDQHKGYDKDHPGWENYQGQTNEYRVFREQDGGIKSIQVIDRSGAGIQESYYVTVLKEVAGAAAMRPVSSEIKEGYEIRKGEAGGLQVIQYRDAQGGRLRGIVVVWP